MWSKLKDNWKVLVGVLALIIVGSILNGIGEGEKSPQVTTKVRIRPEVKENNEIPIGGKENITWSKYEVDRVKESWSSLAGDIGYPSEIDVESCRHYQSGYSICDSKDGWGGIFTSTGQSLVGFVHGGGIPEEVMSKIPVGYKFKVEGKECVTFQVLRADK